MTETGITIGSVGGDLTAADIVAGNKTTTMLNLDMSLPPSFTPEQRAQIAPMVQDLRGAIEQKDSKEITLSFQKIGKVLDDKLFDLLAHWFVKK